MDYLQTGQFFGETNRTFHLGGLTLTDTEYTVERVDWHYHENPYFTFIIDGLIIEGNKRTTYSCPAGTLLFHNWQEPHYNIKPAGYTRGFQIEAASGWFKDLDLDLAGLPGYINVELARTKILFHNIYKETRLFGVTTGESSLTIEALLLEVVQDLKGGNGSSETGSPAWVKRAAEILREQSTTDLSLTVLANQLGLHPVYLCRAFPKHFGCSFAEYIRRSRVERSLVLLRKRDLTLTDISQACDFADQSHFIRVFRSYMGVSPGAYRKLAG